jgi:hypothetical protein
MDHRAPTSSAREALEVGALWGVMTVASEFGGGHYLNGDPWQTRVFAYGLTAGHLWPLAVRGSQVAPLAARRWRRP